MSGSLEIPNWFDIIFYLFSYIIPILLVYFSSKISLCWYFIEVPKPVFSSILSQYWYQGFWMKILLYVVCYPDLAFMTCVEEISTYHHVYCVLQYSHNISKHCFKAIVPSPTHNAENDAWLDFQCWSGSAHGLMHILWATLDTSLNVVSYSAKICILFLLTMCSVLHQFQWIDIDKCYIIVFWSISSLL